MIPRLSEFSYGYALTEELVRRMGPLAAAPRFPSLIEEGRLGYDLELSFTHRASYFLQFKLADLMVRRSVVELKPPSSIPINLPFFRMHFWRRCDSEQHRLLHDLAVSGEEVYYVAPEFNTAGALNDAYSNRAVVERSAFFAPDDIGPLPDDGKHHMAYEAGAGHGWFCSDPIKVRRSRPPSRDGDTQRHRRGQQRTVSEELQRLTAAMLSVLNQRNEQADGKLDRVSGPTKFPFDRPDLLAPYLAQVFFHCALVLVADEPRAGSGIEKTR